MPFPRWRPPRRQPDGNMTSTTFVLCKCCMSALLGRSNAFRWTMSAYLQGRVCLLLRVSVCVSIARSGFFGLSSLVAPNSSGAISGQVGRLPALQPPTLGFALGVPMTCSSTTFNVWRFFGLWRCKLYSANFLSSPLLLPVLFTKEFNAGGLCAAACYLRITWRMRSDLHLEAISS